MALREEQIEVNGVKYAVRELSARQMIPLMETARESSEAGLSNTYAESVFEASVTVGGKPISLDEVSGVAYLKVLPIVMRLNGLNNVDVEGNA